MTTNEAAQRLRSWITANEYLYHQDEKAFLADVDEALAWERRATIERIYREIERRVTAAADAGGIAALFPMLAVLDDLLDEDASRNTDRA